jgi:hypothetical protein
VARSRIREKARIFVSTFRLKRLYWGCSVIGLLNDACPRFRQHNVRRGPLRCAPIQCLATFQDVVHGPHRLLDGCSGIGTVTEDKIHILELKAPQRLPYALDQSLAIQRIPFVDPLL